MVQYVVTPWRDRTELLRVKEIFFPPDGATSDEVERKHAVDLVSVWVQRGNCPHLIESTAMLVSAILNDTSSNSVYALRAAYSAAFCRFVTGLLDGYQDKRHKMSMYSIAKTVGLPATFVELRHQCTHEELPSLPRLRSAAQRSLEWIWHHCWKDLGQNRPESENDTCRQILETYLHGHMGEQGQQTDDLVDNLRHYDRSSVLQHLMDMGDPTDVDTLLRSTRLVAALLNDQGGQDTTVSNTTRSSSNMTEEVKSFADIRDEMVQTANILTTKVDSHHRNKAEEEEAQQTRENDDVYGWQRFKGPWIAKPIGIV